jgi:hypothetical protein
VITPRSFDRVLGATFALIDRFGLLVGLDGAVVAAMCLLRTTAAGLWERRRDVGVIWAVGWRRNNIQPSKFPKAVRPTFVSARL